MDNYIAVVFNSDEAAFEGLHALWHLDETGDITIHGAAVIHRDRYGHVDVATKDTDPGVRTIVGVGLGALVGALAGPVGAAAGIAGASTIAAGTAAAVGAATGGAVGLTADAVKAGEHEEAAYETGFVMNPGQAAVIAEVSEDWTTPIDTAAKRLGGTIYRRQKSDVRDSSFFGDDYSDYLYPYDYKPYFTYA
jgi:uncharacterized membrane protein